jgi:hypothetical protein
MITETRTYYYYLVNFEVKGHHYKSNLTTTSPIMATSPEAKAECQRYYAGKKGTSLHKITNITLTLQKQIDKDVPIQVPQ